MSLRSCIFLSGTYGVHGPPSDPVVMNVLISVGIIGLILYWIKSRRDEEE